MPPPKTKQPAPVVCYTYSQAIHISTTRLEMATTMRFNRTFLCFLATLLATMPMSRASQFSNVTLTSLGGDLSVVVYLPSGIHSQERSYYYSSRFDHGSMIGSILRKTRDGTTHELYGTDMWRTPHNSNWPESGVGLASEFGVGDDGAFCFYRCGWNLESDISNGLLGYLEAKNGESFLKIGVGELVKGTCPACDSAEDYKFNSPYSFAKTPKWIMPSSTENSVSLEHEATLRNHGYRLRKDIILLSDVLTVTSTLTNLGTEAFSTAWYSHNFFTCDGTAPGPGYSVDLNLKGQRKVVYEEPGTWSWSTPIEEYADIGLGDPNKVQVRMDRAVESGVRIKAEFVNDDGTNGGFKIRACDVSIESSIPEVETSGLPMYAYNLYIERGTFSPEPQVLINVAPGESQTWTQRLVISDDSPAFEGYAQAAVGLLSIVPLDGDESGFPLLQRMFSFSMMLAFTTLLALMFQRTWNSYRQQQYTPISG